MKRFILISVIALAAIFINGQWAMVNAQERTTMATLYPEFKPSVI